jgi:hypothetical protein
MKTPKWCIAKIESCAVSSPPLLSLATLVLLVSCHDTPAPIVGVSPPRAPERSAVESDGAAGEPSPVADDFRTKMKLVADRFLSRGHAERFDALVWANDVAEKSWSTPSAMAVGALLIEETIARDGGTDRPGGLLVMEKADLGSAGAGGGGGWRYVVVAPSGEVTSGARLAACETCHREAKGSVFPLAREAPAPAAKETPPSR